MANIMKKSYVDTYQYWLHESKKKNKSLKIKKKTLKQRAKSKTIKAIDERNLNDLHAVIPSSIAYKKFTKKRLKNNKNQSLINELVNSKRAEIFQIEENPYKCIDDDKSELSFYRKDLIKALRILNSKDISPTKEKYIKKTKEGCKKATFELKNEDAQHEEILTNRTLFRAMRTSVLNNDWDTLTELLILFSDTQRIFEPIKWKYAFINLLNNSLSERDILNEFLTMCVACPSEAERHEFMSKMISIKSIINADEDKVSEKLEQSEESD